MNVILLALIRSQQRNSWYKVLNINVKSLICSGVYLGTYSPLELPAAANKHTATVTQTEKTVDPRSIGHLRGQFKSCLQAREAPAITSSQLRVLSTTGVDSMLSILKCQSYDVMTFSCPFVFATWTWRNACMFLFLFACFIIYLLKGNSYFCVYCAKKKRKGEKKGFAPFTVDRGRNSRLVAVPLTSLPLVVQPVQELTANAALNVPLKLLYLIKSRYYLTSRCF